MKPVADDLVDVRDAAAMTGRTAETVRRWVWSGRVRARKEGRRLLIRRSELDAMVEAGSRSASLADWITETNSLRGRRPGRGRSAADLVLDDRRRRYRG